MIDLEHFSNWLKKFPEDEREEIKKLVLDYLATLDEHDLLYQLNNRTYWDLLLLANNNSLIINKQND
jgi:hypothetical protein